MPRILIVDKSLEMSGELAGLLRSNHDILTADGLAEATAKVAKNKPELILMDMKTAIGEGVKAGNIFTGQGEDSVPVIFVTTPERENLVRVFSLGGNDYISYPFIESELTARINAQLELAQNRKKVFEYAKKIEQKNYQLKDAFEQMENMARIDLLTNLPNKAYMVERMHDEIARAFRSQRPITIMVASIDNFSGLIQEYGKQCGDFILQKLADTIKFRRRGQDVVSRWGQDEFVIMLPETYLPDGGRVAERVRNQIETGKINYAGKTIKVTTTIGVTEFTADAGMEGTMQRAENAVAQGKKMGENCVIIAAH